MAVHYVIDGYNLLFALPEIPAGSWPEKRAELLDYLERRRPHGPNPATIVFDSRQGLGVTLQHHTLRVVFTAGETADDYISAWVRRASHPRMQVVVSNDQGIRTLIKGTGARFMSTDEFLKKASKVRGVRGPAPETPDAKDITEEFKKRWL
jgi:predicted RNA-binding protein with PIN domain